MLINELLKYFNNSVKICTTFVQIRTTFVQRNWRFLLKFANCTNCTNFQRNLPPPPLGCGYYLFAFVQIVQIVQSDIVIELYKFNFTLNFTNVSRFDNGTVIYTIVNG